MQTVYPHSIIVSDNYSNDDSMNIIRDYNEIIDKILQPPESLSYMQHLFWILNYIRTDYVIFLAGDDIAHPKLIEKYMYALKKVGNTPAFVCSPFYFINSRSKVYNSNRWLSEWNGLREDMLDVFSRGPICNISNVAWKAELLRLIPPIPDNCGNCIDLFLYMFLSSSNPVYLVNRNLLFYRVHTASTGNSNVVNHTKACKDMCDWIIKRKVIPNLNLNIIQKDISGFEKVINASNNTNQIEKRSSRFRISTCLNVNFIKDFYLLSILIKSNKEASITDFKQVKQSIKKLREIPHSSYREWQFKSFMKKIHPQTWLQHDELLQWAEQCINKTDKLENPKLYEESEDPIVRQGYELVKEIRQKYSGKYSNFKNLRILVHLPSSEYSTGGYSLFNNLIQALDFIGIQVKALEWNDPIENYLHNFKPNVLMTSDNGPYLAKINWDAVAKYRNDNDLKVGLTASLEEYGNSPLASRLKWAKDHQVDFYYSFRVPEYLKERKEYQPFFENGYQITSVEFGANPLLYYPVPGIKRDLNYVFLGSSNRDKWPRYFAFLTKLLSNHSGFIDGPGWPNISQWAPPPIHRFLYARAKVGLNLHIRDSIDWASELNERTYILAACGVPQLVDDAQLLPERFSDDCFFVAETPKEYEQLFIYMLNNPEEAKERALKAQREVLARHTVFHRAEGLISALKKIL